MQRLWFPLICLCCLLTGCDGSSPTRPQEVRTLRGSWSPLLKPLFPSLTGDWSWSWTEGGDGGPATLEVRGDVWTWRLLQSEAGTLPDASPQLTPADSLVWHTLRVDGSEGGWLPLPRLPVESPFHLDLLHLLRELTHGAFGERVPGWFTRPIPVHAPPAVSGAVDLREELRAAVLLWNAAAPHPLFRWAEADSVGGIRLVHLAGRELSPVMSAYILRRTTKGDALQLHIRVGDTYHGPQHARYARRAFLHELAHALLLWDHTPFRGHLLWRSGPIVDAPSPDELQAALWLEALPRGLDLGRYGGSAELDPQRQQGQRTSVEELGLHHHVRDQR